MAKRIFKLAAAAAVLASGVATAQQVANPDPATVRAGNYTVEPLHTRILFSVSHIGFSTWYGDFSNPSGTIMLDPKHPAGSRLRLSIPIGSITTTNAGLDAELKGADWLDATRFPTATFVSTAVQMTSDRTADVSGNFTLHGVTKPIVLHASFNGAGLNPIDKQYTAGFEVKGSFRRSDFGVTKYVPLVGDDVQLIISAAFVKPA